MKPVELHAHSYFSFLDGLASPEDLVSRAKDLDYAALALTDHGGLFGVPRFLKAAEAAGVRPVVGCELYVSPTTRTDRSPDLRPVGYHLTLLAETVEGYRNLVKLSTAGYMEGFFHRPRIDLELLAASSAGLILLTGCIHSAFADRLLRRDRAGAEKLLGFYLESFGRDRVFLELQGHGLDQEAELREAIRGISRARRFRIAATNDVHYLSSADAEAHQLAMDMRSRKLPTDPRRSRFLKPAYGLLTASEWKEAFADVPESLETSAEIAGRCKVRLSDLQSGLAPETEAQSAERLRSVVLEIISRRASRLTEEQTERIERELKALAAAGLSGYMLRVHELVSEARREGILIGPGRGSAAGSYAAFLLGITEVDPLAYGLSFERFVSPARRTMPDIDLDVDQRRRDRMVAILSGLDDSIRTFRAGGSSSVGLKAALREVARSRGMSYREVDDKVRSLPDGAIRLGRDERPPWSDWAPAIHTLAGLPRGSLGHPAGVVAVPAGRESLLPLYASADGAAWLQFDGDDLETLGLQKLDILPLKILAVMDETVRWLKRAGAADLDLSDLPQNDAATFSMLASGRTLGIFQLESAGMRRLLKDLAPGSIESLAAALALYRPGPLEAGVPAAYIERRHGRSAPTPPHPVFESGLKETFGLILYQEQLMDCAVRSGLSAAEADEFRLAVGRVSRSAAPRAPAVDRFVDGLRATGLSETAAAAVLSQISVHGAFAFNKAHAVAYAMLVYRAAYLKCHFPAAFLAALANESTDDRRRLGEIFSEARRRGLRVAAPDINRSSLECVPQPENGVIRLGLRLVRHLSDAALSEILRTRPFDDLTDLLIKVPELLKGKSLEALCKSGALDEFGPARGAILESLPMWSDKIRRSGADGAYQTDLFDEPSPPPESSPADRPRVAPAQESLFFEHEALGCFATGSPLDDLRDIIAEFCSGPLGELVAAASVRRRESDPSHAPGAAPGASAPVTVAGLVTGIRLHTDKAGREMAFVKAEDGDAEIDVIFFADAYQRYKAILTPGMPLLLRGRLEKKGASVTLLADQAVGVDQPDKLYESIFLKLDQETGMDTMKKVKQILKDHPGDRPVHVEMPESGGIFEFRLGWSCRPSADLRRRLETVLGPHSVFFLKSKPPAESV
ncbi:DNA polymerase III subunit alpha [bacterium]|nr:DNA polymerase III subunit alpha [bacterium]